MFSMMMDFNRGVMKLPPIWRAWLVLLVTFNFVIALFFIGHVEARWVIFVFMLGGMIGMVLNRIQGFTKLLGVMHIGWFPLLYYLWLRLQTGELTGLYSTWLWALVILNAISLVIDVSDVFQYIIGRGRGSSKEK